MLYVFMKIYLLFWQNKGVLTYGHLSRLPLFLHQVKMLFQYIPNEVSYVYKSSL
jgi:hypothetical protein